MKKILTYALTLMVVALLLMQPIQGKETQDYGQLFEELMDYISEAYAGEEVSKESLFTAAMKGMFSPLDDYSVFYNEEEAKSFQQGVSGQYVGIGVSLQTRDGKIIVDQIFPGGAAGDAGVKKGDVITSVNGQDIRGLETQIVINKIVGPEGTYVRVGFMRGKEEIDFEMERRLITIPSVVVHPLSDLDPSVSKDLEDRTLYLEVSTFGSQTDDDFDQAINQAKAAGKDYLVLDLRDNGGGYVDTVVNMARQIIPKGKIVSFRYKDGFNVDYESQLEEAPFTIVAITNENSASATEILTSAIQDSGVGALVGETTFGKGVAQTFRSLGDDYSYKLTIQSFFSRNGHPINGVGVTPDVSIPLPDYIVTDKRFYLNDDFEDVTQVEWMLKYLGYFNDQPDTLYDRTSFQAVKSFQADQGLYPYGVCDYTTQTKLNQVFADQLVQEDPQILGAIELLEKLPLDNPGANP